MAYVPPSRRVKDRLGGNGVTPSPRSGDMSMATYPVSGLRNTPARMQDLRRRSDLILDGDLYSVKEIDRYFWPEEDFRSVPDTRKTLHDSADAPGKLTYVLLFKDANPRWDTDAIIFTKSNLALLPAHLADQPDATPPPSDITTPLSAWDDGYFDSTSTSKSDAADEGVSDKDEQQEAGGLKGDDLQVPGDRDISAPSSNDEAKPIAVFMQLHRGGRRSFKFSGYHRITRLQFLEPNTPELTKMLQQKWSITNQRTGRTRDRERDAEAWEKSYNMRWAVVKFEKDGAADKKLGKPQIETLQDNFQNDFNIRGEQKSVNDMLSELRMKDADGKDGKKEEGNKVEKNASHQHTHNRRKSETGKPVQGLIIPSMLVKF